MADVKDQDNYGINSSLNTSRHLVNDRGNLITVRDRNKHKYLNTIRYLVQAAVASSAYLVSLFRGQIYGGICITDVKISL
jgi:hypothetical protein